MFGYNVPFTRTECSPPTPSVSDTHLPIKRRHCLSNNHSSATHWFGTVPASSLFFFDTHLRKIVWMVLRSSGWSCTTRQPWSPAALCTAARSTRLSTRDSITQGPFVITDQTWMKQPWPAVNDSHCPISRCIGARGSCVRSPGDWHKVGPLTTS